MNYQDPELLEQLAAQYVIGTLRGAARRRFERLCVGNPTAQKAVRRWEDRFMNLLKHVKPATPPNYVWTRIEKRLGFVNRSRRSFFGLLGSPWGVTVLASMVVLAMALGLVLQRHTASLEVVAVITQPEGELWRIQASRGGEKIVVEATARVAIDTAHAYELWALPASGASPISLGLLPMHGKATLTLSSAQAAALIAAKKIAVSLEPPGGSTTGAPTGPVIHVVDVLKLS